MEDWDGDAKYAIYSNFVVAAEEHNYALTLGTYRGTAGTIRACVSALRCVCVSDLAWVFLCV